MHHSPEQPRCSPVEHSNNECHRYQNFNQSDEDLLEDATPGWPKVRTWIARYARGRPFLWAPHHLLSDPGIWIEALVSHFLPASVSDTPFKIQPSFSSINYIVLLYICQVETRFFHEASQASTALWICPLRFRRPGHGPLPDGGQIDLSQYVDSRKALADTAHSKECVHVGSCIGLLKGPVLVQRLFQARSCLNCFYRFQ